MVDGRVQRAEADEQVADEPSDVDPVREPDAAQDAEQVLDVDRHRDRQTADQGPEGQVARGAAGEQPDQCCEQEQVANRVGARDDLAEDGLPAARSDRGDDEHTAEHGEPGTDDRGVEEGCTVPAAAASPDAATSARPSATDTWSGRRHRPMRGTARCEGSARRSPTARLLRDTTPVQTAMITHTLRRGPRTRQAPMIDIITPIAAATR